MSGARAGEERGAWRRRRWRLGTRRRWVRRETQCGAMADAARCASRCSVLRQHMQRAAFSAPERYLSQVTPFLFSGHHTSASREILFTRIRRFFLPQRQSAFPSSEIRFSRFRGNFFFSRQSASASMEILFTRIRRAFLPQRQSASSSSKIRLSRFRRILLFLEQSV